MEPARPPLDPRIVAAFPESFDLGSHLVCSALMGSTSHNTYVPKDDPDSIDDVDVMCVVVPPPSHVLGLREWQHWVYQHDELDVVGYSLRKFVGLLLKANPNVVGLLWLRPEHYVYVHPAFEALVGARDAFSSRQAYHSFAGYASAQVEKMQGLAFRGYMGAKRKQLVERHGYDSKMAAHAVRLLRMGVEFLRTGRMQVYRSEDADQIRAIKRGEWTLDQVKQETDRLFGLAAEARDSSPLPEHPDTAAAERLLLDITFAMWRQNGEAQEGPCQRPASR